MLAGEWRVIIRTLAVSVRELRLALGWSQNDLATRAVVSQGAISRLEAGDKLNLPLHTVVVVMQQLAHAAQSLDIPLTPSTQALVAFLAPYTGTVTTPLDPTLVSLVRVYQGFTAAQQQALVAFLKTAARLLAIPSEVAWPSQQCSS